MITKSKIIKDINYIRDDGSIKFKNFGGFIFRLMMLSVEDQEFVVDNLFRASKDGSILDDIVIYSVRKLKVKLKEKHFRFILEYKFRCKFCKEIRIEEINLNNCKFSCICEMCIDKAIKYNEGRDSWLDKND